jgi:hypothetical protein
VPNRASGDHLLAYRRDHIVVDPLFVETLGPDPDALGRRQLLAMRLRAPKPPAADFRP